MRKLWADIFKGILICWMVWAHSGVGYSYILQFLIGAFFFISGYLTGFEKDSLPKFVWKRFVSVMLPYFSLAIVFFVIVKFWMYISPETQILQSYVPDWGEWKVVWKRYGDAQVDVLGATWFLPTLFFATVFLKTCLDATKFLRNKETIRWAVLCVGSYLVFLAGIHILALDAWWKWYLPCALIGQFFVFLGALTKRTGLLDYLDKSHVLRLGVVIFTLSIMFLVAVYPQTIEYAGRKVRGNLHLGILAALNGTLFLVALSKEVESWSAGIIVKLKRILSYVGENTMGVLCFHFLMFKVVYLILIALGVLKWKDMSRLFPADYMVSYHWAPLFVLVSVSGSLIIWALLTRIPIVKFILCGKR